MFQSFNNRIIIEGFVWGALTAVFELLAQIPALALLCGVFAPLPLAIVVKRRDLKTGALAFLVACLFFYFISHAGLPDLIMTLQIGLLGLLLGVLLKNNVSTGQSITFFILSAAALTLISFSIISWNTKINMFVLSQESRQSMEQILRSYVNTGTPEGSLSQANIKTVKEIVNLASELLPANLVITSMITSFITYVLSFRVLRKLGSSVPAWLPFIRWQFPWYLVWSLITGLVMILAGDYFSWPIVSLIGRNVFLIAGFIYFLDG
ncbi:MAG: hypothetical protein XD97_0732, partial [Pelotomaculum thermopropionicum]